MKKLCSILPIVTMLIIASCQTTPPPLDSISIQNTAVALGNTAMAVVGTGVAQTSTESAYSTAFYADVLTRVAGTPVPTKVVSHSANSDFVKSWDIYSSEFNSLGGIVTIRKQGSKYTEKYYSEIYDLTVISEGSELKLDGHLGSPYSLYPHDYMQIESNGWLGFYDDQGLIYRVPPLK